MLRFAVALLFLTVSLASAMAAPPERPAPGAVIDEVARFTGLTNDAVSLALKDNAAALGRLTDVVLAVQIAQRFLDAREAEIAADVLSVATDTAAEALLPLPLMTAIKAMRVYKNMLEAARDKIVIPALDRQLYAGYRAERDQNQDRVNAFSYATSQSLGAGGYFASKPGMIEQYIANYKDWNPDLIGEPMRRRAERQVDRFWIARLEATYQQEKAKPQQQATLAAIWASVKDITDQLKAPAILDAGLFIDPADTPPPGWWWLRQKRNVYPPAKAYDHDGGTGWWQSFMISNGVGFVHERNDHWCIPKPRNCAPPWLQVSLSVRLDKPSSAASARSALNYHATNNQFTRLGPDSVWRQDNEYVTIVFVVGPYSVDVSIRQNPRAGLVSLAIAQHYARAVHAKLRDRVAAAGEASYANGSLRKQSH